MPRRRASLVLRLTSVLSIPFVITALNVPLGDETAAAATDPTVEQACPSGTLTSSTYTLTADCDTTVPLEVPDGQTIDGGGFTITAHGNPFNTVANLGVLYNGGTSMNVQNLTIQGTGFANSSPLVGIFFNDAGGSVSGVRVLGITMGNGNQDGIGIRARAVDSPTRFTVTITNSTISGYQRGGLVATGNMTMNVSGSTIGPPDNLGQIVGQNGVQYGTFGAGGSITNSTIIGSSFLPGPDVSTAILLTGAGPVTVANSTITGDTDIGIAVRTDTFFSTPPLPSACATISNNKIGRTGAGPPRVGTGVSADDDSCATLSGNTFSGWAENVTGPVTDVPPVSPAPPAEDFPGYWLASSDGGVFAFGVAPFAGSAGSLHLSAPVVGIAPNLGNGYWLAAGDGGVFSFGAPFLGSLGGVRLNAPIVGIAATGDGAGYFLVAADGGVFAFGDARFQGSMGGTSLNAPVVGMAITPDSQGYYLVAADGGVFAFGDARFQGSMGGSPLTHPVVGMAVDDATFGYWLVAGDGGVFSFGAPFFGSTGGTRLNAPVVGIAGTPDDLGYRLAASDGGVFTFGDAEFAGSMAGKPLNNPVVGITTLPAEEPIDSVP